jgi:excisionase family DNA binding protein
MRLLTIKEACERLRVSRATLYNLVKKGDLALIKIGGKSLIGEPVIERLITQAARTRPRWGVASREPAWVACWEELASRGLVDATSRRAFFDSDLADFKPVKAKGKLASQIIIEERGERELPVYFFVSAGSLLLRVARQTGLATDNPLDHP